MGIHISKSISIHENEVQFAFVRSGGPGGQNVNKVATAVQLRFDVFNSPSLPINVRYRLIQLAKGKISREGILIIKAHRFRSQDQNKQDAVTRLIEFIQKAAIPPKSRHKTKPTTGSKKRRLEHKRRRSLIKKGRGAVWASED